MALFLQFFFVAFEGLSIYEGSGCRNTCPVLMYPLYGSLATLRMICLVGFSVMSLRSLEKEGCSVAVNYHTVGAAGSTCRERCDSYEQEKKHPLK